MKPRTRYVVLSLDERTKMASFLRQEARVTHAMVTQMEKLEVPADVVKRRKTEIYAMILVADMFRTTDARGLL